MKEVLNYYVKQISNSNVLVDLGLREKEYFIVSSHREGNVDNEENFLNFFIFPIDKTYKFSV